MSVPDSEFQALVMAVQDKTATAAQEQRLGELLRAEPMLRAEYVRQMRLDALLHFTAGAAAKTTAPRVPERKIIPFPLAPIAAIAALLMIAATVAALWWPQRGIEVEVLAATGGAEANFSPGSHGRRENVRLSRGELQVRLASGVVLDVAGPVEMGLVDAMHVRVISGRVTADVGERGKGFVIDTPQARVVDLGTRFGVDASDAAHTDVVVFQGKVDVFEPQHGGRPSPQIASLVEGEAVQVSNRGAKKRVTCVFTTGDSGGWSRKPPLGALITDVHDSTERAGSNHFYRVGAGALTAGTSLRQTNPLSWRTLDGSPLPEWLKGGDWVETGGDEGAEVELQVTLARPAMLFVLHDVRRAPPAWLREKFTDTGTRLLLERSSAKASGEAKSPQPFTVWSMKVSQPGTVTLGPSFDPGQAAKGRRYRVAANALP